jgi:hypothetical protein
LGVSFPLHHLAVGHRRKGQGHYYSNMAGPPPVAPDVLAEVRLDLPGDQLPSLIDSTL